MIRVMLAEDNDVYMKGLITILEANTRLILMGIAGNGIELIDKIHTEGVPDIVLTDIQMPEMDGIELTRKLKASYPALPVIALTMFTADCYIIDMLEAGAKGYLDKDVNEEEIFEAIEAVHKGMYYHCPTTTMKLSKLIAISKAKLGYEQVSFSEPELKLIQLICEEYSNKQIAGMIHYSVYNIDKMRKRIMDKMGVKGTAGIVCYAMRKGIYSK